VSDVEDLKRQAGIAACAFVESGMKVGLGTGSTVKYTVIELGRKIAEEGLEIVGVPTSIATEKLAGEVGIELIDLAEAEYLDIVIDGTDEYDPDFQLIKGGGAALLREKIVAAASSAMVVVADDRKRVDTLGAFPLPIEVTPFAWESTRRQIETLMECEARPRKNGEDLLVTDNGNFILDLICGPTIEEPQSIEVSLQHIPGVVEVGLFVEMCDAVILAGANGVETIIKPNGRLV